MDKKSGNGLAGLIVAGYLFAVMYRGKSSVLVEELKKETAFISWVIAYICLLGVQTVVPGRAKVFVGTAGYIAMLTGLIVNARSNANAYSTFSANLNKLLSGELIAPFLKSNTATPTGATVTPNNAVDNEWLYQAIPTLEQLRSWTTDPRMYLN